MKAQPLQYPFVQVPRYLARKYGLNGTSDKEVAEVDEALEGVEALRQKYLTLVYQDKLADEAKAKYWGLHGDPANAESRYAAGAHLSYLSRLLKRNAAGGGKAFVGSGLTVADLAVFDIVDLHARIFGDELKAAYPDLLAHHAYIAGLPHIKEYLASPKRLPVINGNKMG
ncbi:hypothetical protein GPECTOR_53g94 [Gonium pectorale]|uniref:glutathione transferase n=1 Tax=Gonium pectorale TaxID=33097 RepID=A0A150G701_GONPE|nr:hypothetical protein GPECTOR_53g94 [Gonium pectorale]|eukprot:KXZ45601.1 hypothetical protein GPECTOR_53g94 [Gonium pectorale]